MQEMEELLQAPGTSLPPLQHPLAVWRRDGEPFGEAAACELQDEREKVYEEGRNLCYRIITAN